MFAVVLGCSNVLRECDLEFDRLLALLEDDVVVDCLEEVSGTWLSGTRCV